MIPDDLFPLERSRAMQIILYIRNNPGCTRQEVIDLFGGDTPMTIYARISTLLKIDLIEVRYAGDPLEGNSCLFLTPGGKRVAECIEALRQEFVRHREAVLEKLDREEGVE